ncbi:uncharacterized protein MELLADRAFT_69325 [Melampsora larici-populina 98AG31]|uniref:Uncharacterized protein n=1 Tax=Melampsora larici-populina (strain 98AG31 / pathotype 3-4-7) TaxID=747676 RepID=F4SAA3_MELLP|nr:uncharacterized protein MELLADRAFT_69325 [Melampsora larici-populina 98AG31]EGF98416.1 hypothetical protein MELLADRAFT_69325 [Melampsora larici-populina 98AG31]
MVSNTNNELFPDNADPKRKLRAFSRVQSVPPAPQQPPSQPQQKQGRQQPKRKQQAVDQPPNQSQKEQKIKRIVVKGYGSLQEEGGCELEAEVHNQEVDNQRVQKETNDKRGQQPTNSLPNSLSLPNPTMTSQANLSTIEEDPNLLTIKEDPPQFAESESSLEYLEQDQFRQDQRDEEEEEESWVRLKEAKKEPEEDQRERGRLLTGLVSSPSLNKEPRATTFFFVNDIRNVPVIV